MSDNVFVERIEGKTRLVVPKDGRISKNLPVFYNPVMELNRSLSILLINAFCEMSKRDSISVSLPLAGTGARGVRILNECPRASEVRFNDLNPKSEELIRKAIGLNGLDRNENKFYSVSCEDANLFLLNNRSADYVDIDPYGSPNPFLDAAVKRVKNKGVLAVTATDTSALCGTHPGAGERKYWAKQLHGTEMHEVGLRILIRKVQLIATQFDRALVPMLSYSSDHYMRAIFYCRKSRERVKEVLANHGSYKDAGPMWLGALQDRNLLEKMVDDLGDDSPKTVSFLRRLIDEDEVECVGAFDLHDIGKSLSISVPNFGKLIELLREKGFKAARSHANLKAIKSDAKIEDVEKAMKALS